MEENSIVAYSFSTHSDNKNNVADTTNVNGNQAFQNRHRKKIKYTLSYEISKDQETQSN